MAFQFSDDILLIENKYLKREIRFKNSIPVQSVITDKRSGSVWKSQDNVPIINLHGISFDNCALSVDHNALVFVTDGFSVKWEFDIFEDLPFIASTIGIKKNGVSLPKISADSDIKSMPEYVDTVGSMNECLTMTKIEFDDNSDYTNNMVTEQEIPMYYRGKAFHKGHIFAFTDNQSDDSLVVIKACPTTTEYTKYNGADMQVEPVTHMHILSSGIDLSSVGAEYIFSYSTVVGVMKKDELSCYCLRYYNRNRRSPERLIMSNSWGGGHKDACICESFILKEIETAKKLGIDIVQMDDGWQKGATMNSALKKSNVWGSYREADTNFWDINSEKFPHEFDSIMNYARACNVEIGLWFSPDNYKNYSYYQQDAEVLLHFFRKYGIRHFKLDGIKLNNKESELNFCKMLDIIEQQSNGKVRFNMDITCNKRLGFFFRNEVGNLFLENRYTTIHNYYPYQTLCNVWKLSKYIAADRLLVEMVNNNLDAEKYASALAPINYDIDCLFAYTMVSTPLLWMELSSLSDAQIQRLSALIHTYKKYKQDFVTVHPILHQPDGVHETGFIIDGEKNKYCLIFNEQTLDCKLDFPLKEILATNDSSVTCVNRMFGKKNSYLFAILD